MWINHTYRKLHARKTNTNESISPFAIRIPYICEKIKKNINHHSGAVSNIPENNQFLRLWLHKEPTAVVYL